MYFFYTTRIMEHIMKAETTTPVRNLSMAATQIFVEIILKIHLQILICNLMLTQRHTNGMILVMIQMVIPTPQTFDKSCRIQI